MKNRRTGDETRKQEKLGLEWHELKMQITTDNFAAYEPAFSHLPEEIMLKIFYTLPTQS